MGVSTIEQRAAAYRAGLLAESAGAAVAVREQLPAVLGLDVLKTAAKETPAAAINEVADSVGAYTPFRIGFGAKGDVRHNRRGSMTAGSPRLTSPDANFRADDVGKTVMIAFAGNASDLVSTVKTYVSPTEVTLNASAVTTVDASNMHIGTDDGPALQRWLDGAAADGVVARVPLGRRFLCQQLPLRYNSGQIIEMSGDIVCGNGWGGTFALCDKLFGTIPETDYVKNLGRNNGFAFYGRGGSFILSSALGSDAPGKRRKGLGITFTDKFFVEGFRTTGSTINDYFAVQPLHSRRGVILGGYFEHLNPGHGSDGVHLCGACSDIHVFGVHTYSGDDGSSQTHETIDCKDVVMERIKYTACSFRNVGHSGIKAYMNNKAGAAVIQDIEYHNCDLITEADPVGGFGSPIAIYFEPNGTPTPRENGAIMRRIKIFGGVSDTINPLPTSASYGNSSVVVSDVQDLELHGHTIKCPGYTAILLTRCDNALVNDCHIIHTRGPNVVAAGLAIASIAYRTGNTVRVTFTADVPALSADGPPSQSLLVTGAANADNNGGFRVEAIGTNYVDIRNYKRTSAALDETGGTATARSVRNGGASIVVLDSRDPRIIDTKVQSPIGGAALQLHGTVNDTTKFVDGAVVRGLEVYDQSFGSAILNYNARNSEIRGIRLRRSPIDMIINEAGTTGAVAGGHRYIDNVDVDKLSARALLKLPATTGPATVNRGNISRQSDSLRGTANQASGATTFTISIGGITCERGAMMDASFLKLAPMAAVSKIDWNAATSVFTVTTAAAAAAQTAWPWAIEQPNS